jgi:hypothetical protein
MDQRPAIRVLLDEIRNTGQSVAYLVDANDEVTHLFWAHPKSIKLAQRFTHSLVMDSTYKTNRFRMPMLHVVGMTSFNTSFTVAIVFMKSETAASYEWALQQLMPIFANRNQPACITTDRELALINAIASTFPTTIHLLCLWHINKNVTVHCKELLRATELCNAFIRTWQKIVHAGDAATFDKEWTDMEKEYSGHPTLIDYLQQTWLPLRQKFVKAWTDKVRHFGNATTSRAEGQHSALKLYLQTSTKDLRDAIKSFILSIESRSDAYDHSVRDERLKVGFTFLKDNVYKHVHGKISQFALKQVHQQYTAARARRLLQETCTGTFEMTMGMPCQHTMRKLYEEGTTLQMRQFHRQWFLLDAHNILALEDRTSVQPVDLSPIFDNIQATYDILPEHQRAAMKEKLADISQTSISIFDPAVTRPGGRPPGSLNSMSRQAISRFDSSTRRIPSLHELVEWSATRVARVCSGCKRPGHNLRTCPERRPSDS